MSSSVTGKEMPVKIPVRSPRLGSLRLARLAVAFVMVAGSLGLATATTHAQTGSTVCPSEDATAYSDVPETSFAYDDSRCLREVGISGDDDNYRPGDDMTRSEMAGFMANAYEALTGDAAEVAEHMFEDVADDANADNIARIFGLEITTGTSPTTYAPEGTVIRGHMALFLTRLYMAVQGEAAPTGETTFTDIVDISDEQQTAIGQLLTIGVTTGTSPTTFSPANNVTREQMASFVARMYRYIKDQQVDPPAAPTGVTVEVSGSDGTELAVSWTAPEDTEVDNYVVQWKSGEDDYSEDNQATADDASYSATGLTAGTEYTFRVASVNGNGQSDWSDEASGSPGTAPGKVQNLVVAAGNKSLTLTWEAPEDDGGTPLTGHTITYRSGRGDDETAEAAGDATSHTITGLTNGTQYRVSVTASNGAGDGEPVVLQASSATTPKTVVSDAPSDIVIELTEAGTGVSSVRWLPPAEDGGRTITRYAFRWRVVNTNNATATPTTFATTWVEQTVSTSRWQELSDTNLGTISGALGQTVEIEVKADNTADDGGGNQGSLDLSSDTPDPGLSETLEGSKLLALVPQAPTGLVVTPHHQSLGVEWTAAGNQGSPITGYKVSWSDGGTTEEAVVQGLETTMFTITGLDNRYSYAVSVKATNSIGDSAAVDPAVSGRPIPSPGPVRNLTVDVPPQTAADGFTALNAGTNLDASWDAPAENGTAALRVPHPGIGVQGSNVPSTATVPIGAASAYLVEYRLAAVPDAESQEDCASTDVTFAEGTGCPAGAWSSDGVDVNFAERSAKIGYAVVAAGGTPSPLEAGALYDVRVAATNSGGNPDPDNDGNVDPRQGPWTSESATPANVPAAIIPNSFVAESGGQRSVILSWAPADGRGSEVTHYLLRYAQNPNGRWTSWQRVDGDKINNPIIVHRVDGLGSNQSYAIQIKAVNEIGEGSDFDSVPTTETVDDNPNAVSIPFEILPPTNVTATPTLDGNGTQLTVKWNRVSTSRSNAYYRFEYVLLADDFDWTTITTAAPLSWTAAEDATPTAAGATPTINTVACGVDAITFTPEGGAEIVRCPVSAQTANITIASDTTNVGSTYTVRMRAIAPPAFGVDEIPGANAYVTAVAKGTPAAPTTILATYNATTKAVDVTWDGLTGSDAEAITGYRIRWFPQAAGASGSSGQREITDTTAGEFAITGLTSGTYAILVQALNEVGASAVGSSYAGTDDGSFPTDATDATTVP